MKPPKRSRVDALTPTGAAITVSTEALPSPDMVPINGSLEEDILDQQSLGVRFLASRQFPQTSSGLDSFDANAFIEEEDLSFDDYLFSSNVPMGANLALGFVISASYGCKFGKYCSCVLKRGVAASCSEIIQGFFTTLACLWKLKKN